MDKEVKIFKALSDPIRLKLAVLLAKGDEICVCKFVEALNEPQFKISRHLGILRNAGLVEARRQGTWMYYTLTRSDSPLSRMLSKYLAEMARMQSETHKRTKTSSC